MYITVFETEQQEESHELLSLHMSYIALVHRGESTCMWILIENKVTRGFFRMYGNDTRRPVPYLCY